MVVPPVRAIMAVKDRRCHHMENGERWICPKPFARPPSDTAGHINRRSHPLELNPGGSVSVTGVSREYSDLGQMLRFGFITDQTVLGPFARALGDVPGTAA